MNPAEAPTRPRLDRAAVVGVALGLADSEGLDAVTIRRLAKELHVTPTALYWHFADKQALLDALADQLWTDAEHRLDHPPGENIWDELRQIFEVLVKVFRNHPALAHLAPTRVMACEPGLAITDRTLGLLGQAGYDTASALDAAQFLLCTAIMLVTSQPGFEIPDQAEKARILRQKRAFLLTLPPQRFPHVEAAVGYLVDSDDESDRYYELGVRLIMAGLQAKAGEP